MRVTDRFQIVFGVFFWAALIGIVFAVQDGCDGGHRRHTVQVNWDEGSSRARSAKARAHELSQHASAHYNNRGYEQAVRYQEKAVAADPEDARNCYNLACYLSLAGRHGAAVEALTRSVELNPYYGSYALTDQDFDPVRADEGFQRVAYRGAAAYAVKKRQYRTAYRHFQHLVNLETHERLPADVLYQMACSAACTEDKDSAFLWLERALDKDLDMAREAIKDSRFAKLKDSERFYEIVAPAFLPERAEATCELEATAVLRAEAEEDSY